MITKRLEEELLFKLKSFYKNHSYFKKCKSYPIYLKYLESVHDKKKKDRLIKFFTDLKESKYITSEDKKYVIQNLINGYESINPADYWSMKIKKNYHLIINSLFEALNILDYTIESLDVYPFYIIRVPDTEENRLRLSLYLELAKCNSTHRLYYKFKDKIYAGHKFRIRIELDKKQ